MRTKFNIAILLSLAIGQVFAQGETLTTFILVRHAEKEVVDKAMTSKDPKLSDEGLKRANQLAALFSKTTIDVVYSTPFIRTRKTVEPLAQSKSLSILEYEPNKLEVIDKMLADHPGKTIVVCGHSNTIPKIANHLTKTGSYKDFDDADYGNILIVTVSSNKNSNSVTWLRY